MNASSQNSVSYTILNNGVLHRILIAKVGLDGHDRGARLVARVLRDAGYEVIYTGLRQTAEMVLATAEQEDVDLIGLSVLSGAHLEIVREIVARRAERGLDDVGILIGGVVPPDDIPKLEQLGVTAVIRPGASSTEIVNTVRSALAAESAAL